MKIGIIISSLLTTLSFLFNLLGLMGLVPLYITVPPLFLSLLITIFLINERNRFKGIKNFRRHQ